MTDTATTWRFPRAFWTGNAAELCERAAYYGTFIVIQPYLTTVVGLSDIQAGWIGGPFAAFIYLAPTLTGALADRMGFRNALALAFILLACGYSALGAFSTFWPVIVGLILIVIGGAFVKPVITGTVSTSSDATNRARAFSIFYMVVNIGSFTGKTLVADIRINLGLQNVPWFSAGASVVALVLVLLLFRPPTRDDVRPRTITEAFEGLIAAVSNLRFLTLILITAGFWAIQGQLYAAMPAYVFRMAGESYRPEWYANVNPLVVVLLVVAVTQLVRKWKPQHSILVALGLIPFSALAMASSAFIAGPITLLGLALHPITVMMVVGIAIQGVAECFLSPRYLEFASKQSPPGKEGLYLGFAHLNTFFAWLFGFVLSGYLLQNLCPEPTSLSAADQLAHTTWLAGGGPVPAAYAHAHWLWFAYAGVGATSFVLMLVYVAVTNRLDRRTEEGT